MVEQLRVEKLTKLNAVYSSYITAMTRLTSLQDLTLRYCLSELLAVVAIDTMTNLTLLYITYLPEEITSIEWKHLIKLGELMLSSTRSSKIPFSSDEIEAATCG
jgi:hypothetical protein